MAETNINLDVKDWSIKLDHRRRNRMKLVVKLNKEQAEGFKAFQKNVKPEAISEEEFLQLVLFNGVQRMNEQLYEIAQKYVEEHQDELEASGISIIDDGDGLTMEATTEEPVEATMSASSVEFEEKSE